MNVPTTSVTVADGKYTVCHEAGTSLRCLRNGEPWRDLTGDGMVLALVHEIETLREALAAMQTNEAEPWLMISPDGVHFTGESPLKAAAAANRHRVATDPVAAKQFAAGIEALARATAAENERLLAEHGKLNCPSCGGSGHVGDAEANAAAQAVNDTNKVLADNYLKSTAGVHSALAAVQAEDLRRDALNVFDGPETPQAIRDVIEWYTSTLHVLLARASEGASPIDMVLHCPACGLQHVDGVETDVVQALSGADTLTEVDRVTWGNPPHRSHLCHGCGHVWRPADVPTNGVAAVRTRGKDDRPVWPAVAL